MYKKNIFLLLFVIIVYNLNAQYRFSFEEDPIMVKSLRDEISNDEVMIVFNGNFDLKVTHVNFENEGNLIKENGLTKFIFPYRGPNGTIILEDKYNKDIKGKLLYGMHFDGENNFRSISAGEIIWINLKKNKILQFFVDKSNEKLFQIDTQNDAVLVINVQPYDLDLKFSHGDNIKLTKRDIDKGKYIFYVKPNNSDGKTRELQIKANGFMPISITLDNVNPKEYFNYIIKDNLYKKGEIIIDSKPSGADLKIEENPYLKNAKTPFNYKGIGGKYTVILSKKGYHITKKTINIGTQKKITIPLEEKKAYISINGIRPEHKGAYVYIDNKFAGKIPIKKYKILEGEHTIKISKENYLSDKAAYNIFVKENEHLNFDDFKLYNIKRIEISSDPSGAEVYIDGQLQHKKTNFKKNITIGKHTIKLVKKHYSTLTREFEVTRDKNKYHFDLTSKEYFINIETPYIADVYVDGKYKGTTQEALKLPKGLYRIKLKNTSVLPKHFLLNVSHSKTISKRLYPASTSFIGITYGVQQVGFDLGLVLSRWYIGAETRINIRKDAIHLDEENVTTNVNVDDIEDYDKPYGRIYDENEDAIQSYGVKFGYMLAVPFPLIVNAGVGFLGNATHNKVYKAKNDYYDGFGNLIISKDDLFSTPDREKDELTVYTFGVILPISSNFMVKADYFTDSFVGSGFNVGIGIKYDLISKNN